MNGEGTDGQSEDGTVFMVGCGARVRVGLAKPLPLRVCGILSTPCLGEMPTAGGWKHELMKQVGVGVGSGRRGAWGCSRCPRPCSNRLSLCGSLAPVLPDSLKQEDFIVKRLYS